MKEITLHMSRSKYGDAELIDEWHKERGFKSKSGKHIGYHKVFLNGYRKSSKKYNPKEDGKVELGRDPSEKGAHCRGHNDSLGWVFIGMSGDFSDDQIVSCFYELRKAKEEYGSITVKQHSDYDPKNKPDCAGFTEEEMERFNQV